MSYCWDDNITWAAKLDKLDTQGEEFIGKIFVDYLIVTGTGLGLEQDGHDKLPSWNSQMGPVTIHVLEFHGLLINDPFWA